MTDGLSRVLHAMADTVEGGIDLEELAGRKRRAVRQRWIALSGTLVLVVGAAIGLASSRSDDRPNKDVLATSPSLSSTDRPCLLDAPSRDLPQPTNSTPVDRDLVVERALELLADPSQAATTPTTVRIVAYGDLAVHGRPGLSQQRCVYEVKVEGLPKRLGALPQRQWSRYEVTFDAGTGQMLGSALGPGFVDDQVLPSAGGRT